MVPTARVLGEFDRPQASSGLFDASRLVIDWLEAEERSQFERAMAFRYLQDAPEYPYYLKSSQYPCFVMLTCYQKSMRTILACVLVIVACIVPSFARLGESKEEITARYGAPVRIDTHLDEAEKMSNPPPILGPSWIQVQYKKGAYSIRVVFYDGVSVCESYGAPGGLSPTEVQTLLSDNAERHTWSSVPKEGNNWTREDGAEAVASRSQMTVREKEYLDYLKDQKKKENELDAQSRSLDGF